MLNTTAVEKTPSALSTALRVQNTSRTQQPNVNKGLNMKVVTREKDVGDNLVICWYGSLWE